MARKQLVGEPLARELPIKVMTAEPETKAVTFHRRSTLAVVAALEPLAQVPEVLESLQQLQVLR